jgi:ABC-type dipeptide/oligopeptide/nickel transport system permease subunit
MVRSLATTVCLAIAAVVFTVATAEAAPLVNIYGNLGSVNSTTTSNSVGYLSPSQQNEFQSQGFSVGNQVGSSAWDIQEIQVGLGSSGSPSPVVGIYSDFASINGAVPGTLLATFTGSTSVSSKAIYTFTGSFTALENTSYWVVLSNANSASQQSYEWYSNDAFSQPTQQNASNVTYLGTKQRDGLSGTWNSTLPSLSIGINAVAVPEPPTYALAMVAGVLGAGAAALRRSKKA